MKKDLVIIILIVLVLGLGGYLVFDKILGKEPTKEKEQIKEEEKEEQTTEYDGLVEQYTGKFLTFHLRYNNGNYNIVKIAE